MSTTSVVQVPPPVFDDPFVDAQGRLSSDAFNWFLINVLPRLNQTSAIYGGTTPPFERTGQSASIAAFSLPLGSLSTGYFRVTVWVRITTPAGVSSSVTPFLQFTSKGVACTVTGAAVTSNAINLPASQTFLIHVQAPGPIQIGVTYASNPASAAVYEIACVVERVQ